MNRRCFLFAAVLFFALGLNVASSQEVSVPPTVLPVEPKDITAEDVIKSNEQKQFDDVSLEATTSVSVEVNADKTEEGKNLPADSPGFAEERAPQGESLTSPRGEPLSQDGEIILIDDYLPESSTTDGVWGWDTSMFYSGQKSHTEPSSKGVTEHSFTMKPVLIPNNSVIEQYVYLDPENTPKGIMLKFKFENGGKEGQIGIYREGEEEVFFFNNDEPMIYSGTLPSAGQWEKLQIYCDDLGLDGVNLTGISFVAYGGKAYWDLTRIRPLKSGEKLSGQEKN